MSTVRDIYEYINKKAPFNMQIENDNSGFLVGDLDKEVKCVTAVLDITMSAVFTSKEFGADLIISHHPVIYKPVKSFTKGSAAFHLAESGIAAICAHTSLDAAQGGVNDVLSSILELNNVTPEKLPDESYAILRKGYLGDCSSEGMEPAEFAAYVKEKLGGAAIRYNKGASSVKSVAVCGGSGADYIDYIISQGIDALVTGDAGYHDFLTAKDAGITLIAAGHFNTEDPVIEPLAKDIASAFTDIKMIRLKQSDPISHL